MAGRLITARSWPQVAGGGLWLALALPAARMAMEADMSLHMLGQIPLLMLAGWLAAANVPAPRWYLVVDEGGWFGILVAVFVASYWMVPSVLDAALIDPRFELLKFLGLPLLVGVPVRWSWPRLSMVGRGFIVTNMLSMTAFVGWLYIAAPVRVCVYYLVDQQAMAGKLLLAATALASLLFFLRCLLGAGDRVAGPSQRTAF